MGRQVKNNRGGARRTDPSTSHHGARDVQIRTGTQKARIILWLGVFLAGTWKDIADGTGLPEAHKRISDLANEGYVKATASTTKTVGTAVGRIYMLTAKGQTEYDRLR